MRLLLAHLGRSYERREVDVIDRSNRQQLLGGLNPAPRVPTLVLDDGRSLPESNAILWYLADGTSYLPETRFQQAKVLQWLFLSSTATSPTSPSFDSGWLLRSALELVAKRNGGEAALDALEGQLELGPYLVGDVYTTQSRISPCMRIPTTPGLISQIARRFVPGWREWRVSLVT